MRGTVQIAPDMDQPLRITPARAGNRDLERQKECHFQDHPRACGEQLTPIIFAASPIGSPPRVRGTVPNPTQGDHYNGITPARAGNSKLIGKSAGTS